MFDCLVCSPPYADDIMAGGYRDPEKENERERRYLERHPELKNKRPKAVANYGSSSGQLGAMKPGSPCETPMNEVETLSWDKDTCFSLSWQGLITPESFAHPAKMARGQLFRLIRWLFETGRVKKGDTLIDPFGGVSTTAIAGASAGLKVVTCELEPKFHALALENMEIHRRVWEAAGDPQPTCLLGDSRKLAEVVGPVLAQCCVSSPPYADCPIASGGSNIDKNAWGKGVNLVGAKVPGYSSSPGNLGNLPPGDALVSSPPYENTLDDPGRDPVKTAARKKRFNDKNPGMAAHIQKPIINYGRAAEGNVGNTSGETFWSAARTILEQCHLLLKPGATTCWVVKSYVKAGKIVPFPDQWAALLESCGFRVTHRIRCHLVSETREADLFGGETVTVKSRKSFFRRLHEKKRPDLAIDFEEIAVAVKVGEGGSAGAVVSSPPYAGTFLVADGHTTCQFPNGGSASGSPKVPYGHTAGQMGGLPPGTPPGNPASRNGGEVVG